LERVEVTVNEVVVTQNIIICLQAFRLAKYGAMYACEIHKHSLERKRVIVCLATGVQLKSMDQLWDFDANANVIMEHFHHVCTSSSLDCGEKPIHPFVDIREGNFFAWGRGNEFRDRVLVPRELQTRHNVSGIMQFFAWIFALKDFERILLHKFVKIKKSCVRKGKKQWLTT
jgi:hypothetical protein